MFIQPARMMRTTLLSHPREVDKTHGAWLSGIKMHNQPMHAEYLCQYLREGTEAVSAAGWGREGGVNMPYLDKAWNSRPSRGCQRSCTWGRALRLWLRPMPGLPDWLPVSGLRGLHSASGFVNTGRM